MGGAAWMVTRTGDIGCHWGALRSGEFVETNLSRTKTGSQVRTGRRPLTTGESKNDRVYAPNCTQTLP